MSDDALPLAEPQAIDEQRYMELRIVADDAMLRRPAHGDEHCSTCRFYLEPDADLSFCWHPKLRILVGGEWWCQWWYDASE